MSHFALRVGNLFHFHPFAHAYLDAIATPKTTAPAGIVPRWEPSHPKGLAFFGLCVEGPPETGRAEMDRLALVCDDGDPLYEQDGIWLSLM
jgi:hypothetical protein